MPFSHTKIFLLIDDIEFTYISQGKLKGTPCVRLRKHHRGQKNRALTTKNHTVKQADRYYLEIPKTDNPLGLYNLLYKLIHEYMPPPDKEKPIYNLFRHGAGPKQIEVS